MYKTIVKPILFLFSPEKVHHFITGLIVLGCKIPGIQFILSKIFNFKHVKLERELFGLKFKNPVGLAAGFDKNGEFYNQFSAFGFSFIEVGTVTPLAQPGNEKPRSFRLPSDKALVNRMGFNNRGVEAMVFNLKKNKHKVIVGGNIGKNTNTTNENANGDYLTCFNKLYDVVDYFVVNISCPNIKDLTKLQNKDTLMELMSEISTQRKQNDVYRPVLIKISPDLGFNQIDDILDIITATGMDGVVATNTTIKRDGLISQEGTISQIGHGGLSGLPIKDRSTEIIRYIHTNTHGKLPIIGVGGVMTAEDALEKLKAGASLIQLYTGFIYSGPSLVKKINKLVLKTIILNKSPDIR